MTQPISTISFAGVETLSLRQLDELNRVPKGTSFRAFKTRQADLVEGVDYHYLDAAQHASLIEQLKRDQLVYGSSRNLVLVTRAGYLRLSVPSPQAAG